MICLIKILRERILYHQKLASLITCVRFIKQSELFCASHIFAMSRQQIMSDVLCPVTKCRMEDFPFECQVVNQWFNSPAANG